MTDTAAQAKNSKVLLVRRDAADRKVIRPPMAADRRPNISRLFTEVCTSPIQADPETENPRNYIPLHPRNNSAALLVQGAEGDRILTIGMADTAAQAKNSKVLLFGWDAADWKAIRQLMTAGGMPDMSRLFTEGCTAAIQTDPETEKPRNHIPLHPGDNSAALLAQGAEGVSILKGRNG